MYMMNNMSSRTKKDSSPFISCGLFVKALLDSTGALTSSAKVTQVIGSPRAAVDRQAGGRPRVG